MASTATTKWAYLQASRAIVGKTYKLILLGGVSTGWQTAATAAGMNFVSDIVADEVVHASYGRQTVVVTVTEDDTNKRAKLAFADATYPVLAFATEIKGGVLMEMGTTDADSPIVRVMDYDALNITPNGQDLIVRDAAGGSLVNRVV
jgi:hypothetical protein